MIEKSILIILPAKEFNDKEYINTKSVLEKLGFQLFIASDSSSLCLGSNGLKVRPDVSFFNIHEQNFAAIIFVGGAGAKMYWDNRTLHKAATSFFKTGKIVAAICSAPIILSRAGLLKNFDATSYPSNKKELEKSGAKYVDSPVVKSQNIITAQGPESAIEFANAIASVIRTKLA